MATVAAIRAGLSPCSSSFLLSSPHTAATTSAVRSPQSDRRNVGPQVYVAAAAAAAARPSSGALRTFSPRTKLAGYSTSSSAAALSSSFSHVPIQFSSKQLMQDSLRRRVSSASAASPRCETDANNADGGKTPFGYTRKDVILIGVGLLVFGFALKYGLELSGVDSIKAGNAVQLIMVLGLTVGWISTYVFRVSSKEMTYAKQLKDYENRVMEKRLEEMPEAELESMLAQIEEDKRILRESRDNLL